MQDCLKKKHSWCKACLSVSDYRQVMKWARWLFTLPVVTGYEYDQSLKNIWTMLWDTLFEFWAILCGAGGWTQRSLWVPSNSEYSLDPWFCDEMSTPASTSNTTGLHSYVLPHQPIFSMPFPMLRWFTVSLSFPHWFTFLNTIKKIAKEMNPLLKVFLKISLFSLLPAVQGLW